MKKASLIFKSMLMLALMCVPFALTSCEEEEVVGTILYSTGFETVSGDLGEMATIEYTYKNALGISNSLFTMTGKVSECDQKIIDACKKAEAQLASHTFKGSFGFYVDNNNTKKRIYFYQIN